MSEAFLLYQKSVAHKTWSKLEGSSLSLALAEYAEQQEGIKLFITKDNLSANLLLAELPVFLSDPARQEVLFFPDWETLPYDPFSPHQDLISERLALLSRVQHLKTGIIITAISTLMHRLPPLDFINQQVFILKKGQKITPEHFRTTLQNTGYHAVPQVLEHGEYALRGSIIDLFPMGSSEPIRIELFDDEIESLRTFNPETQRTLAQIQEIKVLPGREFPQTQSSRAQFRSAFRAFYNSNPARCPLYESVSEGVYPAGLEYYLPLFFEKTQSFFDYLPKETSLSFIEDPQEEASRFWKEVGDRFEQRRFDVNRPILPPEDIFIPPIEFFTKAKPWAQQRFSKEPSEKKGVHLSPVDLGPLLPIDRKNEEPLSALRHYCSARNFSFLIVVESAGRREVLLELLKKSQIHPKIVHTWSEFLTEPEAISLMVAPLSQGFELPQKQIALIVEAQLFGSQSTPQRRSSQKSVDPDLIIRDMAELQLADPVVHLEYGVGRYQGLQYITTNDKVSEFLVLRYANEDTIYVPVTSLHLISRYSGADKDHAPLHRLGSDQWQKEKKKACEKIHDVAIELLDLYAKRQAQVGNSYELDEEEYLKFASSFPFTETTDQQKAIAEIIKDMQSPRPMDRLICGDVGFGKTEVAMRAAFLAVQNTKQVCVLAPTTLLAGQHFDTFKTRFAELPVRIELLSRFRSNKESEQVIENLKNGRVDIVIGTHKLIHNPIDFHNLGLLIIDEEHRFGVKQKEHMKALRTQIDILSMTATPIPRTLNMAMAGIRDISLISTPPAKRLAIKTFWQEKTQSILKEAMLREILRGGQVFFLHNKIQSISKICEELQQLVPEAKIQIAHGQMPERKLERIMSDFYHHRFNVLVCTTIIETGIDIPTANTIIIDRADEFGLAQLHQLKGRVGRSHHQAYAYLLTPDKKTLKADAVKRLEALVSLEDLGAGFTLATYDLEIRGAGELLGEDQSGNIEAVGFNLFMTLLDKAVSDLKEGKIPELSAPMNQGPEIDLNISAIIPETYIADIHHRLIVYKRIANAQDSEQLQALESEFIDRFGLLPESVKHLFKITQLKLKANTLGIKKIRLNACKGSLLFDENPRINPEKVIKLIQIQASRYQLDGPKTLRFTLEEGAAAEKIDQIIGLLEQLSLPS